jgi:CRP-like cAMP-binding protein
VRSATSSSCSWTERSRSRRTAAAGPVRFFVLTRQAFRGLIDHHPDIEAKVLECLEQRVGETEDADA